ncbi:MAG TPA: SpoIID/LytB domain-containing protein [Solirubrobacteraceae bacterium]
MRRLVAALLTCAGCGLLAPAACLSAPTLIIDGGGDGHGVGMSQWGADGLAQHGFTYQEILAHYYTGTTIGSAPAGRVVRVLMQSGRGSVVFTGASGAGGHGLAAAGVYTARPAGRAHVALSSSRGRRLVLAAPLTVAGAGGVIRLDGTAGNGLRNGRYRGSLEILADGHGGLEVLDLVGIDDYARGVVAAESDASWPLAELEAQAVASRTYAITDALTTGFDVYADTRSQQYGGIAAETPASDAAVAATAGQVVTYQGKPVITYFFDSSGGETESVQNAFPGSTPEPWLVGVPDPYDTLSPSHHFGPKQLSLGAAGAALGSLLKGSLKAIDVTHRGVSPRILRAVVVGTGGSTTVTGDQLATSFGLPTTWICFTVAKTGTPASGWDSACQPPTLTLTAPPGATAPGGAAPPAPPPSAGPTGGNAAPG